MQDIQKTIEQKKAEIKLLKRQANLKDQEEVKFLFDKVLKHFGNNRAKLARELGVAYGSVYYWSTGEVKRMGKLAREAIRKLAKKYGVEK